LNRLRPKRSPLQGIDMNKGWFRVLCVLGLILGAPATWAALQITAGPTLTMDPYGVTPLSGLVEVTTNIPSQATLEITDGIDSWRVRLPRFLTDPLGPAARPEAGPCLHRGRDPVRTGRGRRQQSPAGHHQPAADRFPNTYGARQRPDPHGTGLHPDRLLAARSGGHSPAVHDRSRRQRRSGLVHHTLPPDRSSTASQREPGSSGRKQHRRDGHARHGYQYNLHR